MSKQQAKSFVLAEPVVIDDQEPRERIDRVAECFGNVTHLKQDIIDHLIEMGRVFWPQDLA